MSDFGDFLKKNCWNEEYEEGVVLSACVHGDSTSEVSFDSSHHGAALRR